jgi:quercetin dioxygenase-like cupin family protein
MKKLLSSLLVTTIVLVSALGAGCQGNSSEQALSPSKGVTEVTRQPLLTGTASRAPGQALNLDRVIIPAGQEIAAHTHPGTQLATIVEGILSYTVIKGEVKVTRAAGTQQAKVETFAAGQTAEIRPGDALVEMPEMVHSAKNNGKSAVVIYLSSLFPDGAPASSPAQ